MKLLHRILQEIYFLKKLLIHPSRAMMDESATIDIDKIKGQQ